MEIPEEVKDDVVRLQMLQQKMQSLLMQKQTVSMQLVEVNNALKELESRKDSDSVFEIVGSIMLKKSASELSKSLTDKKDVFDLRLKSYDKQVKSANDELSALQEKIVSKLGRK